MTSNHQLAGQLRGEADDAMHRRKVLLACAVALAETKSVAAARKVIAEWNGPEEVKAAGLEVLDALAVIGGGR